MGGGLNASISNKKWCKIACGQQLQKWLMDGSWKFSNDPVYHSPRSLTCTTYRPSGHTLVPEGATFGKQAGGGRRGKRHTRRKSMYSEYVWRGWLRIRKQTESTITITYHYIYVVNFEWNLANKFIITAARSDCNKHNYSSKLYCWPFDSNSELSCPM